MTTPATGAHDREALIALAHVLDPADVQAGRLVSAVGARSFLERIIEGDVSVPRQVLLAHRLASAPLLSAEERADAVGARIVTRLDREWPSQLDDLGPAAPWALWVVGAGDLRLAALRSVAVVGARACSAYGEEVARTWSAELADEGWAVVSGGAFGIDAAAHRGALAAEGVTCCVLAGGVDVPYPRAHDALLARIADDGLVISESPMGEAVRRQRFLTRNRLIAGVTRATVVVEAAERSGTMATAQAARAMNRLLLAVPGPVTSSTSAGCHRMIRDGDAVLVSGPDEVLGLLDLGRSAPVVEGSARPRDHLSVDEKRILDALPVRGAVETDALSVRAGVAASDAWTALGLLESAGWVEHVDGGWRLGERGGR